MTDADVIPPLVNQMRKVILKLIIMIHLESPVLVAYDAQRPQNEEFAQRLLDYCEEVKRDTSFIFQEYGYDQDMSLEVGEFDDAVANLAYKLSFIAGRINDFDASIFSEQHLMFPDPFSEYQVLVSIYIIYGDLSQSFVAFKYYFSKCKHNPTL